MTQKNAVLSYFATEDSSHASCLDQTSYFLPLDEYDRRDHKPADFMMKPVNLNVSVGHFTITLRQ